jgi:hypothetical protein
VIAAPRASTRTTTPWVVAIARARRAAEHTTPRHHQDSIPPSAGVLQLPGGSAHPYRRRSRGLQRRPWRPRRPGRAGRRDVGGRRQPTRVVFRRRRRIGGPGRPRGLPGRTDGHQPGLAGDPATGRAVRLRAVVAVEARPDLGRVLFTTTLDGLAAELPARLDARVNPEVHNHPPRAGAAVRRPRPRSVPGEAGLHVAQLGRAEPAAGPAPLRDTARDRAGPLPGRDGPGWPRHPRPATTAGTATTWTRPIGRPR